MNSVAMKSTSKDNFLNKSDMQHAIFECAPIWLGKKVIEKTRLQRKTKFLQNRK